MLAELFIAILQKSPIAKNCDGDGEAERARSLMKEETSENTNNSVVSGRNLLPVGTLVFTARVAINERENSRKSGERIIQAN